MSTSPAKRQQAGLNWLDRVIAHFNPSAGWQRLAYRRALASAGGYEGGRATRLRKAMRDNRSPDMIVGAGAKETRSYARHLERNHDMARGALRVLVRNIVGPNGITIEPMPRTTDGKVDNDFADQIMRVIRAWSRAPEVTRQLDFPMSQRMACRAWLRDGEQFTQTIPGFVPGLTHGTPLPFSIELLESDLVPLDWDDLGRNIRQGIQCNAWGAPTFYHVYRGHPLDSFALNGNDLKQVPADRMLHLALRDRLHQRRGVTLFCAVVNRLEDAKEISDYEIAAAKIAGALTAVISRDPAMAGSDPLVAGQTSGQGRDLMRLEPGMIYDGAQPGEEITVVDSKRPNSGVAPFLDWNGRMVAAGLDVSASSITRNYDGSYSSQRQELVETDGSYRILRGEFVGFHVRPIYERALETALAAGILRLPARLDPYTLFDADFRGPPMPWIQPVQEANAELINVRAGFKSMTQVIRERGGDPWATLDQLEEERREAIEKGLVLESDFANDGGTAAAADPALSDPNPDGNPMPPGSTPQQRRRPPSAPPPINVTLNAPSNAREDELYRRLLSRVPEA